MRRNIRSIRTGSPAAELEIAAINMSKSNRFMRVSIGLSFLSILIAVEPSNFILSGSGKLILLVFFFTLGWVNLCFARYLFFFARALEIAAVWRFPDLFVRRSFDFLILSFCHFVPALLMIFSFNSDSLQSGILMIGFRPSGEPYGKLLRPV